MRSCCIGCEKGNTSHDLFFAPCILVSRVVLYTILYDFNNLAQTTLLRASTSIMSGSVQGQIVIRSWTMKHIWPAASLLRSWPLDYLPRCTPVAMLLGWSLHLEPQPLSQKSQVHVSVSSFRIAPPSTLLQRTGPIPYYKVPVQYYKVLVQYYKVLVQQYSSTTEYYKVLLRTTKYYSSTTPYYKLPLQY